MNCDGFSAKSVAKLVLNLFLLFSYKKMLLVFRLTESGVVPHGLRGRIFPARLQFFKNRSRWVNGRIRPNRDFLVNLGKKSQKSTKSQIFGKVNSKNRKISYFSHFFAFFWVFYPKKYRKHEKRTESTKTS